MSTQVAGLGDGNGVQSHVATLSNQTQRQCNQGSSAALPVGLMADGLMGWGASCVASCQHEFESNLYQFTTGGDVSEFDAQGLAAMKREVPAGLLLCGACFA